MATEYTPNYNLDLYSGDDKPNLRDQYNAAMNKIDSELLELANKDTSADNLIYALQQNLKNVESDVAENTANIATNKADIATNKAAITANTNAIDTLQTQFGDADSSIKELQTNVATNTANIATNKASIDTINTSLNGYTVDIANLTTKVDSTASQFDQLKSDVEQYDSRITEAQTNASNALSLAQTNEQDIGLAEADITQLTQGAQTINTRIDNTTLVEGWSVEQIPISSINGIKGTSEEGTIYLFTNTAKTLFKVAIDAIVTGGSLTFSTIDDQKNCLLIKENFTSPSNSVRKYTGVGMLTLRNTTQYNVTAARTISYIIDTDGSLYISLNLNSDSSYSLTNIGLILTGIQMPLTFTNLNLTIPDLPDVE